MIIKCRRLSSYLKFQRKSSHYKNVITSRQNTILINNDIAKLNTSLAKNDILELNIELSKSNYLTNKGLSIIKEYEDPYLLVSLLNHLESKSSE